MSQATTLLRVLATRASRSLRFAAAGATLALTAAVPAQAQDDPPGRVGRLVELHGSVSRFDHEDGQWTEAERNRPLTAGDRLSTAAAARVELRVGSTVLRLGGASELEVLRLDDERLVFQLHSGMLALRVRSREVASEIEVVTDEARLRPTRSGHYRFDRIDDTTHAGSWRGELRLLDADNLSVAAGQRVELYRQGRSRELRHAWSGMPEDAFASWVDRDDRRDERTASTRHVSPEMTGAEDLDRHGSWDRHAEYGAIWFPYEVRAGWAPYRYGHWAWVRPWGWTWVDEARWGFAPFHYGRWVHWRDRWGWVPGTYVARPVYAPALVAWVGGPQWGVSVNIGAPAVGWVPLAPREAFVPYYRSTPVYVERLNPHLRVHSNPQPYPRPGQRPQQQVPTGPIAYGNQGVPGGITVVPRDVLSRREPVGRAVVIAPQLQHALATDAPPAPPGHGRLPTVRVAPPADRHAAPREGHSPPEVRVLPPQVHLPSAPGPVSSGQVPQAHAVPAPASPPSQPAYRREREERGDSRSVRPMPQTAPAPAATPVPAPVPRVAPAVGRPPAAATAPPAAAGPTPPVAARPRPEAARQEEGDERKRIPAQRTRDREAVR